MYIINVGSLVLCLRREFEGAGPLDRLVPSYCCWEGVLCCHEHSIYATTADSGACAHYSVFMLQLRAGNLTQTMTPAVMGHLQTLHSYGLIGLDLSRNYITGTLPESLNELDNLQLLLLGANSELQDVQQQGLCCGDNVCCATHCCNNCNVWSGVRFAALKKRSTSWSRGSSSSVGSSGGSSRRDGSSGSCSSCSLSSQLIAHLATSTQLSTYQGVLHRPCCPILYCMQTSVALSRTCHPSISYGSWILSSISLRAMCKGSSCAHQATGCTR